MKTLNSNQLYSTKKLNLCHTLPMSEELGKCEHPKCSITKELCHAWYHSFTELCYIQYIWQYIRFPLLVRVFTYGSGDQGSNPGWVIPKTQKMVLDASLLNTQHYKLWIKSKWSNLRKEEALPHLYTSV